MPSGDVSLFLIFFGVPPYDQEHFPNEELYDYFHEARNPNIENYVHREFAQAGPETLPSPPPQLPEERTAVLEEFLNELDPVGPGTLIELEETETTRPPLPELPAPEQPDGLEDFFDDGLQIFLNALARFEPRAIADALNAVLNIFGEQQQAEPEEEIEEEPHLQQAEPANEHIENAQEEEIFLEHNGALRLFLNALEEILPDTNAYPNLETLVNALREPQQAEPANEHRENAQEEEIEEEPHLQQVETANEHRENTQEEEIEEEQGLPTRASTNDTPMFTPHRPSQRNSKRPCSKFKRPTWHL